MIRVYVVVEGPTEESFVKNVLAPSLWPRQILFIPIILGPPGHKGGNVSYARVKKDVLKLLKQEVAAYCTTMLDFYGLGDGFPGTPFPASLTSAQKVARLEEKAKAEIVAQTDVHRPEVRFLPYFQLHEYEALLFSDPEAFSAAIGQPHLACHFQGIRAAFATPEDIDDNPVTAPSKRVEQAYPRYRKILDGTLAGRAVGVAKMRSECPHFRQWLEQIEGLAH